MNVVLILFVHLFGRVVSIEPRSVNLALDTILEFNNKDNRDLQIIDNVQEFLEKIKNVLKNKTGRRSMDKDIKFTDFLIDFFEIIKKYDDDDLEDVVTVIIDEIRKYNYAGCRFFELLQNNDMRKFVGHKLDKITDKTPDDMRKGVENIIDVLKIQENGDIKEFFNYINTLYPKYSRDKLKTFINNIELYKSKSKRANLDLIKIIRRGLRNVIFDHYTNLNANARKDFKIRLETFWKNFKDPYKVEHKVWNLRYTTFGQRGSDVTAKPSVNRELNEQPTNTQKDIDNFEFDTLKYFDRNVDFTTNPEDIGKEFKYAANNVYQNHFPGDIKVTTGAEVNIFSTIKDIFWQIKINPARQKEIKSIDKSIIGQFKDDITSKNIVKEFEETIDLNLPDISTMVEQKFDSITDVRLSNNKKELLKDTIDNKIDTTTKKSNEKIKKHKTKPKNKIKHKTHKRFSIVTTDKTTNFDNFYDSEEVNNMDDRKTTKLTIRKRKTSTKRKHKRVRKQTTKSRLMTLFMEEYTTKVKKIRTRDKATGKHIQYASYKDVNKHRSKNKKSKRDRYTSSDTDKYYKRTTELKKYKDQRHENRQYSSHDNKQKKYKKYSKRSAKTTKKSRKWLKLPTTISFEGMAIESIEAKSYRKNIDFDEFQNGTTERHNIISISKSTPTNASTLIKIVESVPTTIIDSSTFGPLDFWQGNTNVPNTTHVKNTTIITTFSPQLAPRSSNINNTFSEANNKQFVVNETIRLIDINDNYNIEFSTKLPNSTKLIINKPVANVTSTVKSTTPPQKRKLIAINKTEPPFLKRRSIDATRYKITTTAAKPAETTRNPTIFANITKPTFNLGEFLNQSEILNVESKHKKDKITENILKDMHAIFAPSSTTSTTETANIFTDPFNELENALDLD